MEEEEEAATPFWLPPSSGHRRGGSSSSIFLSSGFLVVFLPLAALLLIVFVLPPIISFTSYIFRPNMVKKSWDSLNLVLVLFAIICAFISRGSGGGGSTDVETSASMSPGESAQVSIHGDWYEPRRGYGGMRRLRSSSSYPDLRQESAWAGGDGRWRSVDDTQLDNHRVPGLHRRRFEDPDYCEVKKIDVDNTSVNTPKKKVLIPPPDSPSPPPPTPSPPPPAPPPPKVRRKVKRSSQAVFREERREARENSGSESKRAQISAPPPPPPPPPPSFAAEPDKSERKRGGATKEFFSSVLYHQRNKKKRNRQKSMENLDSILPNSTISDQPLRPRQPPPPPPPLPPPPNSVFHNLFSSKKGKSKRFLTVPPPPPPPPPRAYTGKTKTVLALSQSHPDHSLTASQPPVPEKSNSFNSVDDNPYAGSESPLIPIPPPPPPPPFKLPGWKFVVHGDYVRIKSTNSSRSGSPDLDYIGSPSSRGPSRSTSLKSEADGGGDSAQALFCPSPDVNTKADTFIARFRAGLKLEKVNSTKERQELGLSNLGPEPGS